MTSILIHTVGQPDSCTYVRLEVDCMQQIQKDACVTLIFEAPFTEGSGMPTMRRSTKVQLQQMKSGLPIEYR